jgi:hypothetical protein
MPNCRVFRIALLLVLLGVVGCGSSDPPVSEVEGVVLLDGVPLAKVQVEFIPEDVDGRRLPFSQGQSDENGQYRLMCENGKPGAIVGPHKVVIRRPSVRGNPDKTAAADGPAIPMAYQSVLDTPLKVVVQGDKQSCLLGLESH